MDMAVPSSAPIQSPRTTTTTTITFGGIEVSPIPLNDGLNDDNEKDSSILSTTSFLLPCNNNNRCYQLKGRRIELKQLYLPDLPGIPTRQRHDHYSGLVLVVDVVVIVIIISGILANPSHGSAH